MLEYAMRVITGIAKGRKLNTLQGDDLRPTASRVKEGIFSAIQFDIEGRRVLDLFAGCGALGIEALSRGASRAVFCDASQEATKLVLSNLKSTGLEKLGSVIRTDYSSYLATCRDEFDIIFLDPPYHKGYYENALTLCDKVLSSYGMIICEYPTEVSVPQEIGGISAFKKYRYGNVCVTIFKKTVKTDE